MSLMGPSGFSTPFIQRPVATTLLMAGILLIGLVAYPFLPVAPIPHVDFPTISVNVNLPGASPETVATSMAQPLERQFAQIPGITQMTSTSVLGSASISIQFGLDRNIDAAAQDVQAAINAASAYLPRQLPTPPIYRKVNPADQPVAYYAFQSDVLPLTVVDNYIENNIAQQISQLPGVGLVNIGGQQKPAIRIQIDPVKLAALEVVSADRRSRR